MGCVKLGFMENNSFSHDIGARAKKAVHLLDTDVLLLSREERKEQRQKKLHPLLGAEENFLFIEKYISPAIKDLHDADLNIEFGRLVYNPESNNKFLMYDGSKLHLCTSTGDKPSEFDVLGEIGRKDDLAIRHHRGWDKAIDAFGKVSKEHIFFQVRIALMSLYSTFERVEPKVEQHIVQKIAQQPPTVSFSEKARAFVVDVFHKKS